MSHFSSTFSSLYRNGGKDVSVSDALAIASGMIQDVGGEIERVSPDTGSGAKIEFCIPQDGVIGPTETVTFTSVGDRSNFFGLVRLVRHLNKFV